MKFLVVLSVALACVAAVKEEYDVPIVKSSYDISPDGAYQYAYETGNGIYAQEQGVVKNPNGEYPSIEVKGAFKYTSPEGQVIEQTYTADENGYVPQGSHLPVSPPIPELIARSLQYIASNPPQPQKPTGFQG